MFYGQPRTRSKIFLVGVVCVIGLTCGFLFWWGGAWAKRVDVENPPAASTAGADAKVTPLHRPALPDDGYVGGQVCATCHAKITETFKRHPMSRSMATVQAAVPLEDYQQRTSFEAGPCVYRVERQDNQLIHHESLTDTDGTLLYHISTDIQFEMGSGSRGRSYLTERNDILSTSSISWYSGKGWDLSPGYRPYDHPHFIRRVTEGCVECHAGRVKIDRGDLNHFPPPAFVEAAISCERCHGPGERHVAFRSAKTEQPGPDPIVNPAKLPPVERDAVCYQCHLQARERVLRYGRSHQDFRPGQRISDIWTVFLNGDTTEAANSAALVTQVEQMQSSRCFQNSEGRMGCISCHDPHDFPERESRLTFYQAKCLNCHADQGCSLEPAKRQSGPANGNCVVCHMPHMSSKDVPHTSQSDHRIPRDPANSVRPPRQQALTLFQEPGFQLSELELARARGLMLSLLTERSRNISMAIDAEILLKRALAAAPDDVLVLESLGDACLLQSRGPEAEIYWRTILRDFPQHERSLLKLAILAQDSGRFTEARDLLARFLKVNPTLPQLHFKYAQVLDELGELDLAIPAAKQALAMFPRHLQIYDWLADAYARQGNQAESDRYRDLRGRISRRFMRE